MDQDRARNLLFADVALLRGAAPAHAVAAALQRVWEGGAPSLADALGLPPEKHDAVRVEVEGLIAAADGDAAVALAGRGGIDRSIHTSLRPDTSRAMLNDGVGARAPLRPMADGRYEDFSLIGKGGMGAVYLALDTELNRHVAFKMVRPDPDGSGGKSEPPETPLHATPPTHDEGSRSFDELSVRFLQEAWVTGALEHPGVVPIYELGRTGKGIPFYTMRYVKGERTLAEALKEVEDFDDRLALLEPFLKICDTIRYAHSRDIIHRDLKPENIALGSFGEVIVLDWGLSKMQEQPDVAGSMWRARIEEYREAGDLRTVAGVMGTPGYMAPEAALGKNDEVDARSDVYSLGAMLYQILTGRIPFEFKTYMQYVERVLEGAPPPPHEVDAAVPEELSAVCAKALAKTREERYESVDALARDVRRWQSEGRVARQVAELVAGAESEIEAARTARANMALWHLDRANTACTRALHLDGGHERATALLGEIKRHREQAIRERVSANRRRALVAAGFLVLAVAAVVTMWLAKARADEREAAQRSLAAVRESAAESERRARRAHETARQARHDLANGYGDLARVHLRDRWTAAARLVAIQGVRRAGTPTAWAALAEADARWTPTLRAVVPLPETTALTFAPDGGRLFAGTALGTVYAIDAATGEANELGRDTAEIAVLAVSPDGNRVAAAGHSGRVGVWETATGKLVGWYPGGPELPGLPQQGGVWVTSLAFRPDERFLLAAYLSGDVRQWSLDDDNALSGSIRFDRAVTCLVPDASGAGCWVGDVEGGVSRLGGFLAVETQIDTSCEHIVDIRVADDGSFCYALGRNHRLVLIEDFLETTVFAGPGHQVDAIALTGGRGRLFAAGESGMIRVWDTTTGEEAARLAGWPGPLRVFACSRDDRWFAAAFGDGQVRVFDLAMGWGDAATATLVVPETNRAYVARPDLSIDAWDAARGTIARRLRGPQAAVTSLARHGTRLYAASLDGKLHAWDLREGRHEREWRTQGAPVTALAVRADGQLVSGALDGAVHFWPGPRPDRPVPIVAEPRGWPVCALAAARDTEAVAYADTEGRVALMRRTDSGVWTDPAGALDFHEPVVALAVSPEGRYLAAVTAENALHLWAVADPKTRRSFRLGAQQPVVRLDVDGAGEARWWHAGLGGGHTSGNRLLGIAAGEIVPAPVEGSPLPWVLHDPTRRLIGAENRFGLRVVGMAVEAVPAREYEPDPHRLQPWSR